MKVIATLLLIFSISATSYAKEAGSEAEARITEMGIVTGLQTGNTGNAAQLEVVRLHLSKTSVIKNALSFKIRRNATKMA